MKVVKTTYFQWGPKILLNLECNRKDVSHQINIEKEVTRIAHEKKIIHKNWHSMERAHFAKWTAYCTFELVKMLISFKFHLEVNSNNFQSCIAQLENVEKAASLTFGNLKLNELFFVLYL